MPCAKFNLYAKSLNTLTDLAHCLKNIYLTFIQEWFMPSVVEIGPMVLNENRDVLLFCYHFLL